MSRIFIIAEAGVNHNGSPDTARKLIDAACEAGADAVKFQTFKAENLVCENAGKAEYQRKNTSGEESQLAMLKKLELTEEVHEELIRYCEKKGILFLSTPFDLESLAFLERLNIPLMKIPSGEITNYPYLKAAGQTGKPVILSTGMSTMEEVEAAIRVIRENGSKDITVLHCNTEYPTPYRDVNLSAMVALRKKLGVKTGYSDHSMGIEIPIAAAALGAVIIEKHFTLDREMEGPDHKASLEPDELKKMIQAIRNVEEAMGGGVKEPSESEKKNISVARKSIVAGRKIKIGELFTEDNLTTKRPGNGISPMRWDEIVGTVAARDYEKDELIEG